MFDFLKNNTIAFIAIVVAVIALFSGSGTVTNVVDSGIGAVRDLTTFTNPITFNQEVTINETGVAQDTRIEGGTNANLVLVDGSADIVTVDGLQTGSNSGCFATSTTGTLTETNLIDYSCITISATGAGQAVIALTLPATSTMTTLLANAGECRTWTVDASAVAAATTTTITAGTGWDLVGYDNDDDVIEGAKFGVIKACKETDTDVTGFLSEFVAAD